MSLGCPVCKSLTAPEDGRLWCDREDCPSKDAFVATFDDDLDNDCSNCGGTGFVACCHTEYACVDPEGGCDDCMRRCDWCNVSKRGPSPSPTTTQERR